MRYDIRNLNIWKKDSLSMRQMTKNPVKEISDGVVNYPIYMARQFMDTNIEELNLSVRSYNCLRRMGWITLGDIVEAISSREELMRARNLGKTSAREIFERIIDYHYSLLTYAETDIYKRKFDEVNSVCVDSNTDNGTRKTSVESISDETTTEKLLLMYV